LRWVCQVCGYVYDEEKEGKKFEDLPEKWQCPVCGGYQKVCLNRRIEMYGIE